MKTTTKTAGKKSDGFEWMTEEEREYWKRVTEEELRRAGK